MSRYFVRTQDDWAAIAADDEIGFGDYVFIEGHVVADSAPANSLDVYVQEGGSLTVASGTSNAYTLCGGRLTLVWNGTGGDDVYADSDYGPGSAVTLENWPEDEYPILYLDLDAEVAIVRTYTTSVGDRVGAPSHYAWVGDALVRTGAPRCSADLQSWDLLDAMFPDNPHLWNAGKYLVRFGRKGDASKRVEDLRKAITYLERAIKAEENRAS